MIKHLASTVLTTTLLSAFVAFGPAVASPGGAHGPPPGHGTNPNGSPPIGAPVTHGNTDRGRSEGKGHNDRVRAHVIGRVSVISGNTVTVRTNNGATKTFILTPAEIAGLRTGEHVVVFTNGGATVTRVEPAIATLHGVVTNMVPSTTSKKTIVTVRLPNGRIQTVTVANEAAENMQLRKGEPVVISTTNAFLTPPSISVIRVNPH